MTYSPLVNVVINSPNHSGNRGHAIDTITIHCMAGNLTVESCGNWFKQVSAKASSNYGVDSNGRIGGYVPEEYRSWCTSSRANDIRAITIEVANCGGAAEGWPVTQAAYAALLDLVTDICKRNKISRLLWLNNKSLAGAVDLQNMTVHRWFANKACPGDYLYKNMGAIASAVNERLKGATNMTEEQVREIVREEISNFYAKRNPFFTDISEVPTYWRPFLQELLDRDILNGGTKREDNDHDVNLHTDTVKAVVLMKQYIDQKFAELNPTVTQTPAPGALHFDPSMDDRK